MIVVRTLMGLHVLMVTSLLLGNHAMMESMVMMSKNTPAHQIQEVTIGETVTGKKMSKSTIHLSVEKMEGSTMTVVLCQNKQHVRMVISTLKANTVVVKVILMEYTLASVLRIQKVRKFTTHLSVENTEDTTMTAVRCQKKRHVPMVTYTPKANTVAVKV
jgi:hypothetical protein